MNLQYKKVSLPLEDVTSLSDFYLKELTFSGNSLQLSFTLVSGHVITMMK